MAPDASDELSASTMDRVRQLLYSRASRDEIMETLSMSFRTYLKYVEAIREEDSRALGGDDKGVAGEFKKAYSRLNAIVERCCEVVDDPDIPGEHKVRALQVLTRASIDMLNIANEARSK